MLMLFVAFVLVLVNGVILVLLLHHVDMSIISQCKVEVWALANLMLNGFCILSYKGFHHYEELP